MKKLLLILLVLGALGAGVFYYLNSRKLSDLEPEIRERLRNLVLKASDSLYRLDFQQLEVDVVAGTVELRNVTLLPDSLRYLRLEQQKRAPNVRFTITLDRLSINNIKPAEFLNTRSIRLDTLHLQKPTVTITRKVQPYNIDTSKVADRSLYDMISAQISSIAIRRIIVDDADFTYNTPKKEQPITRFRNARFEFSDILIDSSTQFDETRFLYARDSRIDLTDYVLNTKDNLYRLKIDTISIHTLTRNLVAKGLSYLAIPSPSDFFKKVGEARDYFQMRVARVEAKQLDWKALLGQESLIARSLELSGGRLDIFKDRNYPLPSKSKTGNYPHQVLMRSPMIIKIDTLKVAGFDLFFREKDPKTQQSGKLNFTSIRGQIYNITNDPSQVSLNPICKADIRSQFMSKAPFHSVFSFNLLQAKKGVFTITGQLGKMDATAMNVLVEPIAQARIEKSQINGLGFTIKGDNTGANGRITFLYEDFKIAIFKKEEGEIAKRGFLSFAANLILRDRNPNGSRPPRVAQVYYKRPDDRGFFHLAWKTVFLGVTETVR